MVSHLLTISGFQEAQWLEGVRKGVQRPEGSGRREQRWEQPASEVWREGSQCAPSQGSPEPEGLMLQLEDGG